MAMQKALHQYFSNMYNASGISLKKIGDYLKKQNLLKITKQQKLIMNGL